MNIKIKKDIEVTLIQFNMILFKKSYVLFEIYFGLYHWFSNLQFISILRYKSPIIRILRKIWCPNLAKCIPLRKLKLQTSYLQQRGQKYLLGKIRQWMPSFNKKGILYPISPQIHNQWLPTQDSHLIQTRISSHLHPVIPTAKFCKIFP